MKKPWWVLGTVVAIGLYVALVSLSGEPAARQNRVVPPPPRKPLPEAPSAQGAPKAVVEVLEHDFGVFDPMEKGSHTFAIRNAGDAPLELQKGPATCKCTLLDFPAVIAPGKTGAVRVSWTTRTKYLTFEQQAAVTSNDPDHALIAFTIKGEVRTHLLAEPEEIVFPTLSPGEAQTASTTLFSQAWDQFDIKQIKTSNPDVQWQVKPASAEALAAVKARSGYVLEVTSPTEQRPGHFQEALTIYVSPKGHAEEERHYELLVSGKRANWLSVGGEELEFGAIPFGQSAQRRLTLLLRDGKQKLKIRRVDTTPAFLRTTLTPARPDAPWCNFYYLEVDIPSDAPEGTHLGLDHGELRIFADNPDLPVIKKPLEFAIVRQR